MNQQFATHPQVEALLRLQTRLLHVSRLATVGEMTSGIAHELNQPLCAVANYAQACERLLRAPQPDIDEICQSLQEISAQAMRAGEIIRRLRSLARSEPEAAPDLHDINSLLEELTELICSDTRHHQVRFVFEPSMRMPRVRADRAQIQQLILNLIHNAIEAQLDSPPESREIVVRTDTGAGGEVRISVSDHGPGVSSSIAPHLFNPFCTTKPAGTGLGLAMSRTIAQAHSGTLEYQPNVPVGACFTLTLPAA